MCRFAEDISQQTHCTVRTVRNADHNFLFLNDCKTLIQRKLCLHAPVTHGDDACAKCLVQLFQLFDARAGMHLAILHYFVCWKQAGWLPSRLCIKCRCRNKWWSKRIKHLAYRRSLKREHFMQGKNRVLTNDTDETEITTFDKSNCLNRRVLISNN